MKIVTEHNQPCVATLNALSKLCSYAAYHLSWRRRALLLRVNPNSLATTSTGHFSPNWVAVALDVCLSQDHTMFQRWLKFGQKNVAGGSFFGSDVCAWQKNKHEG